MTINMGREMRRKWLAAHDIDKMIARYQTECGETISFKSEKEWLEHREKTRKAEVNYNEQQGTLLHINCEIRN